MGELWVMLDPDEMERSSAKSDPLFVLISPETGFRMIHAWTGHCSRVLFVISRDAMKLSAEMPPP